MQTHDSTTTRRHKVLVGLVTTATVALAVPVGASTASPIGPSTAIDLATTPVASMALAGLPSAAATLTEEDISDLVYMRQEEKLAGDLYRAFAQAWNLPVFSNIERAERTHASLVAQLLERYGVADPVAGLDEGEFADPGLQRLFDDLLRRGLRSPVDALRVGALVEELDITDLRSRSSDVPAIARVYRRLENGSENHLRAFVRNLDRRGVDYEPVVLSVADHDDIVDASGGRGDARGQRARQRGAARRGTTIGGR